jgi:hypothetical protein
MATLRIGKRLFQLMALKSVNIQLRKKYIEDQSVKYVPNKFLKLIPEPSSFNKYLFHNQHVCVNNLKKISSGIEIF